MSSEADNTIISAFAEERVTRLTGVSRRQLRYWANESCYQPSLNVDAAEGERLRLYSFKDLVCLKVINALLNGSILIAIDADMKRMVRRFGSPSESPRYSIDHARLRGGARRQAPRAVYVLRRMRMGLCQRKGIAPAVAGYRGAPLDQLSMTG
jgi:hypothetical protein